MLETHQVDQRGKGLGPPTATAATLSASAAAPNTGGEAQQSAVYAGDGVLPPAFVGAVRGLPAIGGVGGQ